MNALTDDESVAELLLSLSSEPPLSAPVPPTPSPDQSATVSEIPPNTHGDWSGSYAWGLLQSGFDLQRGLDVVELTELPSGLQPPTGNDE